MIYLVALVVLVLATARLTRLIYFDDISLPIRLWVDRRFGTKSFLARGIWCPWCCGVWAAMLNATAALYAAWSWWSWSFGGAILAWPLLVLALAYPAAWIVDFETSRISGGK